jgi:pimeloyl-ACP methyl ester carboxylesterase
MAFRNFRGAMVAGYQTSPKIPGLKANGGSLEMEMPGRRDKSRSGSKQIVYFGLTLTSLVLLLCLVGVLYQDIASASDLQRYPPPGILVDVDGHNMHIYCLGTGSPTVVLEAGLGASSMSWGPILEEIAAFTRVCAYDRAGLGWSDPLPTPIYRGQVAESLHTLLSKAGIPEPYLLVGHSLGGVYVRAFAERYPSQVAGLVLIDSSHENQLSRLPLEIERRFKAMDLMFSGCRLVSPLGLVRLFHVYSFFLRSTPLEPGDRQAFVATLNRGHTCHVVQNELTAGVVDLDLPVPPPNLGDLPLVVLTAGGDTPHRFFSGFREDTLRPGKGRWLALQDELAALSTNSTHLVIEDSNHLLHYDRPDLVVDVIREMIESIRN